MLRGTSAKLIALLCLTLAIFKGVELRPQETAIPNVSAKCGYASCPQVQPNMLNVHLIPHSHNDVGGQKTVDQYYYGSKNEIQRAGVQYILDSVVQELLKDPKKRFVYAESAYFFKWWPQQKAELQEQVKMLVNEGRLEFIGGAWSMNDEATTHYQSVVDQFAWGLRRLNDTFGKCGRPRVGWQIDPYGHSREMASLFSQMGFDGLFIGRLDYADKEERLADKKAEMIWRSSANLDEGSQLFTGVLYNQYQAPPGFCFDILCNDEPIIDERYSSENNVKKRIDEFFEYVKKQSEYYRTNNIIVTMGGDFTYQDANSYYKNLDKLISSANAHQYNGSNINLLYSTPSCYLKALHDTGMTWPTKDDDFFPYASDPHTYWSGYYTSRPTLKRSERVGNNFLQVCKQLTTISPKLYPEMMPHLGFTREIMGVMQHHDAITGTETQNVAQDYTRLLDLAMRTCTANSRSALHMLTLGERARFKRYGRPRPVKFEFKTCSFLNVSSCDVSEENDHFVITLYNPLGHATNDYVRVPVKDVNYLVRDHKGAVLKTQFVPVAETIRTMKNSNLPAKYNLIFLASELPSLGYRSYYIEKTQGTPTNAIPGPEDISGGLVEIGNQNIRLTFNQNGLLQTINANGITRPITQEFLYYESATENLSEFSNRSSGAYIFKPKTNTPQSVSNSAKICVHRGELVEEVHQKFNDWISQVVRVFIDQPYVEFEWIVGPIPSGDNIGKEIITRFTSDIKSEGIFYTDSNGREMIKRQKDHRDTWKVKLQEPTAGNYYPVTTKIALEDEQTRMALLTDRAQGGTSLSNGSLELMVHRTLLHHPTLNEMPYNQDLLVRGTHYLFLGSSQLKESPTLQSLERFTQLQKTLTPWRFFSSTNYTYNEWQEQFTNMFTGISLDLPQNIHLLTFEPWHDHEILVRFEHILEKNEDPIYSKPVQFNICDIFANFELKDIRQTTLDGSAWLDEQERLDFKAENEDIAKETNRLRREKLKKIQLPLVTTSSINSDDTKFKVELSPMQIKTFVLYT